MNTAMQDQTGILNDAYISAQRDIEKARNRLSTVSIVLIIWGIVITIGLFTLITVAFSQLRQNRFLMDLEIDDQSEFYSEPPTKKSSSASLSSLSSSSSIRRRRAAQYDPEQQRPDGRRASRDDDDDDDLRDVSLDETTVTETEDFSDDDDRGTGYDIIADVDGRHLPAVIPPVDRGGGGDGPGMLVHRKSGAVVESDMDPDAIPVVQKAAVQLAGVVTSVQQSEDELNNADIWRFASSLPTTTSSSTA